MKRKTQLAQKAPASPVRRRLGGLYCPELLEARIAPATIIVNSLLDNGDGANTTLREAIVMANDLGTHPGADTITFKIPAAALPGTIVLNGTEIAITDTLTIKGLGIDLLSVSGSDLSRIFNISDATPALKPTVISGLTLTDGKTAASGGAISSFEPLTLKNVVIRSSYAGSVGGGVFVATDGKISIVSSSIVHNQAASRGGAHLDGRAGVSVVKTTVADNTATGKAGLYANTSGAKSVVLVDTCIIANNTATAGLGGGLSLDGDDGAKVIVKNSLITGNSATDSGGGLYLDSGHLFITNTTFSKNTAGAGGALKMNGESLTISGSRFLGNRATDGAGAGGGALYLEGLNTNTPGTLVKITGSLFSHNTSASDGGVFSHIEKVILNITGSSFLGNTAVDDGGAFALGDKLVLTMKSSILSGNTAGDAGGAIFARTATGAIFPVTPTVLTLAGNQFTENGALFGGALFMQGIGVSSVTANLSGNLFQANVTDNQGGAVFAKEDSVFNSKADRFLGNVARGQGGGVYLINTGGIVLTGSLIQGNVAGSSGGGGSIAGDATLTGVKVLGNIAGPGGRGGGLRISGVGTIVLITKSLISGNVANDGGGLFFNLGTATVEATTIVKGNAALINSNIGSA